jgi:hypothetical protein
MDGSDMLVVEMMMMGPDGGGQTFNKDITLDFFESSKFLVKTQITHADLFHIDIRMCRVPPPPPPDR